MVVCPPTFSKVDEKAVQDVVGENYENLRHHLRYASVYHDWWIRRMLALTGPGKRLGVVLDNGCGIGLLFDRLPRAQAVVGLDVSLGMLIRAHKRGSALIQGDSMNLPFSDESFDLVIARSLLHHLPDPESGMREMHRVLRPGGQVILADTNRSLINTVVRSLAYRRKNFSEHHANFDENEYLDRFCRYFALEHIQHFGFLAYPFGFPDMMGPLRTIPFPVRLIKGLIALDKILGHIPGIRKQSWGLILAGVRS